MTTLAPVRSKTAITSAYYLGFISLGICTSIIGPTLPGLAEQTRSSLSQISFLFTTISLGYMLGSLYGGRAFDKTPGNLLLSAVLFSMTLTLGLTPLISQLWLLAGVLFILGLAEGALDVGGNLLIIWTHRQASPPFLNALHFFFGIGAFIGPVVVAQAVARTADFQWAYWLLAIYPIPIALWLLRLPSPTSPHQEESSQSTSGRKILILLIAICFFLYVGAEIAFGGWIYTYATSMGLGNAASAAYLTAVFWGSLTVGRLISIPLAARFDPKQVIVADLLVCIASLSIILLAPGSLLAVWVGTIGIGLSMASIFPTLLGFAETRLALTGRVTRWFFVGTGFGGMLIPWLSGLLIQEFGPRAVMTIILIDLILNLLIFFLVTRIPVGPQIPLQEPQSSPV